MRWLAGPVAGLALAAVPALALDRLDFVTSGATDAVGDAIRAASLMHSMQSQGQTDPQDLLAAARADYGRILAALYAKGYYSAVIRITVDGREAAGIPPIDVPSAISAIVVRVDPGPPFRFNSARIAPLAPKTVLPDGFRTGLPAESGLVSQAVDTSILAWREVGHAKAAVQDEQVVADHSTALLDVDLQLQPGPRLRFGPLVVTGEERMRERRIRKIAGLPEGEVFSETELRGAEERLRRTGIFGSVTLTEDEAITSPDLLGITATVIEQKPRRYSFGAEIASLDGMSLTGSWLHRNLLGGGERLELEGSVTNIGSGESGVDYAFGVSLDRPATLTRDTTAGLLLEFAHLDETDYSADTVEFGLAFSHFFSKALTGRAGLSYSYQDGQDPGGKFTYRNLSLPMGLTWDRRDNLRDTTRGFYLDASAMPFAGFDTTGSGVRSTFDGRAYLSLGAPGKLTVAVRAQGGAVHGSDLLETPRDLLFFSGGGGTVRGQPYRSLGIPVFKGIGPQFEIGGKFFLAGSLEVRAKITERIGVVGFVDAGTVGLDGFTGAFAKSHVGAGLGLRYDTGLGPIRLDVAAPISGATGDGLQIYIGLGQAF
jgi:translocation and assembly module TamA